ncbi:MAG: DUF1176 domain-containing protein [Pseudomonadota bacterium]
MITVLLSLGLSLLANPRPAGAADLPKLQFSHGDWEIACDNTRTCRAAGYYIGRSGEDEGGPDPLAVSVLLTRKAGPNAPVQGEVQFGTYLDEETAKSLPKTLAPTMKINGKSLGKIAVPESDWTVDLTPSQTQALLAALTRVSEIAWSDGPHTWRLSGAGAAAVLLKMDEFQGRIGTPGAVMRKGAKPESSVLPALATPVVKVPALDDKAIDLPKNRLAALRTALQVNEDTCTESVDSDGTPAPITVSSLSGGKLLASMLCWRAAYNEGDAYWVVNASPPYAPQLVTTSGSGYQQGTISASHKGRGLGDCWSFEAWTWDGRRFVQTSEGDTGDCRLVAPGGAWQLPVLVTDVYPPKTGAKP